MRQLMKWRAICLIVLRFVSPPIREPLASGVADRGVCAGNVVDPERDAVISLERNFGHVALQVGFGNRVGGAVHLALQDRKERFDRVGVAVAFDVFALGVVDRAWC